MGILKKWKKKYFGDLEANISDVEHKLKDLSTVGDNGKAMEALQQ